MDKKNIVVVTFSLSNNGAERVFTELSNEWARQGHSVTVIQFEQDAFGSESFVLNSNVKKVTLNRKSIKNKVIRYMTYLKDIRDHLRKNGDSVVIAFSFTTQIIVAIASFFLKNRIVFSERNDPNNCPYTKTTRAIRNIAFRRAEKIVFQTEDAQNYFSKSIQKRSTIIINPINPDLPERNEGERRNVVITAARLRPQKNLFMLIEAFSIFHSTHPGYSVEIYGIGEEEDNLKAFAQEKHVLDSIHFMGFSSNVNEKMRDASMYVCSSDYEGISNSMLEALGMGLPTISTDCPIGGARQVIRDHENGILVPVRDVEALSKAMNEIAENKELALRLSNNAYLIRQSLQVDEIAKQWVDYIYEN